MGVLFIRAHVLTREDTNGICWNKFDCMVRKSLAIDQTRRALWRSFRPLSRLGSGQAPSRTPRYGRLYLLNHYSVDNQLTCVETWLRLYRKMSLILQILVFTPFDVTGRLKIQDLVNDGPNRTVRKCIDACILICSSFFSREIRSVIFRYYKFSAPPPHVANCRSKPQF